MINNITVHFGDKGYRIFYEKPNNEGGYSGYFSSWAAAVREMNRIKKEYN
jgi:hypothetical protein